MSAQTKQNSMNLITKELKSVLKKTTTLQESIHSLILNTSIHAIIYRDANVVSLVLNGLNEVNGSIRVNAVAYWFKHVGGFDVNQDGKTGVFKTSLEGTHSSDLGVEFTHDKHHVATLKEDKLRFWKVAPKDYKELKAIEDVTKVTAGVEAQYARGLLLGTISEDDILEHIAGMMQRINNAKSSKATKEWIAKFQAQSGSSEEKESDLDQDLIEELLIEELAS